MRHLILITLMFLLSLSSANASDVKTVYDLNAAFNGAHGKVMLMLVSQPGCSYCDQIKDEILNPMLKSGLYDNSTLIREIKIYADHSIKDFNGETVDATLFAKRYDTWATPTLLFLDKEGNQLTGKMVGINTPEFYGYYVDKALDKAQATLASKKPKLSNPIAKSRP